MNQNLQNEVKVGTRGEGCECLLVWSSNSWVISNFTQIWLTFFIWIHYRPILCLVFLTLVGTICVMWGKYLLPYWVGDFFIFNQLFWKLFHLCVAGFILFNLFFNYLHAARVNPGKKFDDFLHFDSNLKIGLPPENAPPGEHSSRFCKKCNLFCDWN